MIIIESGTEGSSLFIYSLKGEILQILSYQAGETHYPLLISPGYYIALFEQDTLYFKQE